MRVIEETYFDDSDVAPDGVCYVGIDRRILESDCEFYVRSYNDEPTTAIVMEPEGALESIHSKALVMFLSNKYGYVKFDFPCDETGGYEEIDSDIMQFRPFGRD